MNYRIPSEYCVTGYRIFKHLIIQHSGRYRCAKACSINTLGFSTAIAIHTWDPALGCTETLFALLTTSEFHRVIRSLIDTSPTAADNFSRRDSFDPGASRRFSSAPIVRRLRPAVLITVRSLYTVMSFMGVQSTLCTGLPAACGH